MNTKAAKHQMMSEIKRLQMENKDLVQRHRALDMKNELLESVVRALENEDQTDEIIHHLKRGKSLRSIAEQLRRPATADLRNISPESEQQLNKAIHQYRQQLVESEDPCFWTNVTNDPVLVEHLVTLYLTWIHPLHVLLDEEEFISSFRRCEDVYCSSSLVNAICAMACHVLRSEWRGDDGAHSGIEHLQAKFMDEVEHLQRHADTPKLVAIQTWAIMSLVELGRGNGLMASAHLRQATELLMARSENEQADTSAEVASWGVLTLATTWSGLVYQKPNTPVSSHTIVFKDVPIERAKPLSQSPQQHSQSDSNATRPDHTLVVAFEQAKLYQIVHQLLLSYCGSRGKVYGSHMDEMYEKLTSWKRDMLTETLEVEASHPLLFLHIQYHVTVIQTLQPMIYTEKIDKKSEDYLTHTILHHAQIAFKILVRYCERFEPYHQSPIQLFCLVHICDALVRYNSNDGATSEVIEFALQTLEEASIGYPMAKILRDSFRQVVFERHLDLPDKIAQELDQESPYLPHDIQNAFTRSTYRQPITQLLLVLDDSLGRDFVSLLQERHEPNSDAMQLDDESKLESMQIKAVLNHEDTN